MANGEWRMANGEGRMAKGEFTISHSSFLIPHSSFPSLPPLPVSGDDAPMNEAPDTFEALGLPAPLIQTLDDLGYEAPTPIQARTIPALLAGKDLIGQAQPGTGKTAAFALPMLARL